MPQLLKIPQMTLDKYINFSRGAIQLKNAFRTFQQRAKVTYFDKSGFEQILTRPSRSAVVVAEVLEKTIGVYFTICDTLISNGHLDRNNPADIEFLNMFALYGGALSGLEELCSADGSIQSSGVAQVRLNFRDPNFYDQFLDTFLVGIREDKTVSSGDRLLAVTKGYLEKTVEAVLEGKDRFPGLVERVNDVNLQIDGITLQGFDRRDDKDRALFSVDFSDLVAVESVVGQLKKNVGNLFAYIKSGDRSFARKVSNIVLLYGPSGTGKSSLVNAVGKYMTTFSETVGVPLKFRKISSDLKSKWMGESTKNLKDAVQEVSRYGGVGFLWTDEADMLFTNAVDGDSTAEKAFLSEAMQLMDGVEKTVPNYFWVMTTNNEKNFYLPLRRRIKAQYLVEGPVRADDHAKLFWMLTHDVREQGLVQYSQEQLRDVGLLCESFGFHGRETSNLANRVVSETDTVTITPEIITGHCDDLNSYVVQNSRRVGFDDIVRIARVVANGSC
ncbi:AAA family ATPase [Candidatus Woesearchaeota archaeon]|nr:AAA family ATPase [Candidatus Woesearchaeota archaeon]